MRLWRWIRKQLDKLPSGRGGLHCSGQWRVLHRDGERSTTMRYDVAKDYASIFGGEVQYARYEKEETKP